MIWTCHGKYFNFQIVVKDNLTKLILIGLAQLLNETLDFQLQKEGQKLVPSMEFIVC